VYRWTKLRWVAWRDRAARRLAYALPEPVVYYVLIRGIAKAMTDLDGLVPEVKNITAFEALQRWQPPL
jgi:hypothetical protein